MYNGVYINNSVYTAREGGGMIPMDDEDRRSNIRRPARDAGSCTGTTPAVVACKSGALAGWLGWEQRTSM